MLREHKEAFVQSMRQDLERAAGVLFVDFTGLTVAEADSLRGKLRAAAVQYRVVKNTLMARALADLPFAKAADCLKGTPTGVVIGFDDPVEAARITVDFKKECEHVQIKGGVVEQQVLNPTEAEQLAKMPSKAEMQAQVVALALAPARNLLGQIKSPAGKIVGVIDKLSESEKE